MPCSVSRKGAFNTDHILDQLANTWHCVHLAYEANLHMKPKGVWYKVRLPVGTSRAQKYQHEKQQAIQKIEVLTSQGHTIAYTDGPA